VTGRLSIARRIRRLAVVVLLALWASAGLAVGATLMISHWAALPRPASNRRLGDLIVEGRVVPKTGRWTALHVLYTSCRCSQRILDHLWSRRAIPGIDERVVLVGPPRSYPALAAAAGYGVEALTPGELSARYGVAAAPLLVVADPSGRIRYSGGYTERKQGPDIRDGQIIAALMRDDAPAALPLFGCAVSRELQQALDPLRLKYRSTEE
jgi:hypothetical protein